MPVYTPALDLILNRTDKTASGLLALLGSRVVASPSSANGSGHRIIAGDQGNVRIRLCDPNLTGERAFDDVDLSLATVRIALGVIGGTVTNLATIATPFATAGAYVTTRQSATFDLPATKRITLDPAPYGGSFIVTLDGNAPFEIPWDAEEGQVNALAGTAYKAKKRGSNIWEISGKDPNQDVTIGVDGTNLIVPIGVTGRVILNTNELAAAFTAAGNPKWLKLALEIEAQFPGEPLPRKLYQGTVEIARALLDLSSLVPVPIPPSDYASLAAQIAGKQAINSTLTSLAALSTTAWGRALLAITDAGALRTYASAQPLSSDLSAVAALSTAVYGRGILIQPDAASLRSYIGNSFANLSAKPTTVAGYGITDLNSLGDARWSPLGHTHPQSDVVNLGSDLAAKAPLASPALSGTPTVPTAANATSSTQAASTAFVHAVVTDLINASPGTLDTLKELADAIGDDPNFAVTVANSVATRLAKASNLADLTDVPAARGNLGLATVAATGLFADLGAKPTTIGGYGITDLNSLGDARWVLLSNLNSLGDARWSALGHIHTFNSLSGKPTDLAGYGITDLIALTNLANSFVPLQTFNSLAASSVVVNLLGTAAAPTVTPIGAHGVTTWSYKIVAKLSDGTTSPAGPAGSTVIGEDILDATNKNSIAWAAVAGAASYDVYRTAAGVTPSTTGKIATVSTNAYVDAGAAGDGSTPPTTNTTGTVTADSATLARLTLTRDLATNIFLTVLTGGSVTQNWFNMGSDAQHATPFLGLLDRGPGAVWDVTDSRGIDMWANPATAAKPFSPFSLFLQGQWWNGTTSVLKGVELELKINAAGDPEFWIELPIGSPLVTFTRDPVTGHAQIQTANQPGNTLEFRAENLGGGYDRKAYLAHGGFYFDQYINYNATAGAQTDTLRVGPGSGSLGNANISTYDIIRSFDGARLSRLDGTGKLTLSAAPDFQVNALTQTPAARISNLDTAGNGPEFEWFSGYGGGKVLAIAGANASGATGSNFYLKTLVGGALATALIVDNLGKSDFQINYASQVAALRVSNLDPSGNGPEIEWFSGFGSKVLAKVGALASGATGSNFYFKTLLGGALTTAFTIDAAGNLAAGKGFKPAHIADAAADNDTAYFSTDAGKMAYKDSGGVVHAYY